MINKHSVYWSFKCDVPFCGNSSSLKTHNKIWGHTAFQIHPSDIFFVVKVSRGANTFAHILDLKTKRQKLEYGLLIIHGIRYLYMMIKWKA